MVDCRCVRCLFAVAPGYCRKDTQPASVALPCLSPHILPAAGCPKVSVHIKGATECYECHPPASGQKTYPICTLRNTPDKPIHCVVWAKELLFPRLFGKVEVSGGILEGFT